MQHAPPSHGVPHPPQLFGSFFSSTHACPHCESAPPQTNVHCPASQPAVPPSGAEHTVVQLPQWVGSAFVSTHAFPHAVRLFGQPASVGLITSFAATSLAPASLLPESDS